MIELRDVGLRFAQDAWVLRGIDLQIAEGEFLGILGPSGCGKSTLLRIASGLLSATEGEALVDGCEAREYRQARGGMAFVFQDPRLLAWRNVMENIALPLELLGTPAVQRRDRARAAMQLVGLADADATKRPSMLSGGMRMRVSLARALVTDPEVLLLDEPFAALDDMLREQLNEELLRIWEQSRVTSLFVTHNVAEAVFLSSRVVVLGEQPGRVVATVDASLAAPRDRRIRRTPEFAALCGKVSDVLRGEAP